MEDQKLKRVFAGYYQRYDCVYIHVILVVDDVDTGDKIVIFNYEGKHDDGKNHAISISSFCEDVELCGKIYPKFKRCTNRVKDEYYEDRLEELGLKIPCRHRRTKETEIRFIRRCSSYEEYAKDICVHYNEDLSRYRQTVQSKQWCRVSGKEELEALNEDISFVNDCLLTSLKKHGSLFIMRYINKYSIRKYAQELGRNRGSVEYEEKKLIKEFAALLEKRDKKDKTTRMNQGYKYKFNGFMYRVY